MDFDVVIVGGGPSGLSAAIRLKQLSNDAGKVVSIEVTNCKDNPSVASHGKGDKRLPTSAVLMIFTFIVVIERACAAASLITLPVLLFACMIVISKIAASHQRHRPA